MDSACIARFRYLLNYPSGPAHTSTRLPDLGVPRLTVIL